MHAGLAITVYLTAALVAAIIAGATAANKRRHPGYWTIFSFLVPPTVLLLLLLPRGRGIYRADDPYYDKDDDDNL
jgi:hypothetical protein